MIAKITGLKTGPLGEWLIGTVENYDFEAKLNSTPTKFGIDGLHVIKLAIKPCDQNWAHPIITYERGWDRRPRSDYEHDILKATLDLLESIAAVREDLGTLD